MTRNFKWYKFHEININDPFFDTLKEDYEEFSIWFNKKSINNEEALVYNTEIGIGAFIYLKNEIEEIKLINKTLPIKQRVKIGTLKLSNKYRNIRLGEGALGVALWKWQEIQCDEIYITVFEKHIELINLLKRFGFKNEGITQRGEIVYIKNRYELNHNDPYNLFPYISDDFDYSGIIPIYEEYHDKLFPYSELYGNNKTIEEITAGNGITKVFIATPSNGVQYKINEPVFIYRIHNGKGQKTYKSALTSYCTITKIEYIKNNMDQMSLENFITQAGNKTVFTESELIELYKKPNVIILEMIYNGFFGKGNNIIHKKLSENNLFNSYPYNIVYNKNQFLKILEMSGANVQNIIINKP